MKKFILITFLIFAIVACCPKPDEYTWSRYSWKVINHTQQTFGIKIQTPENKVQNYMRPNKEVRFGQDVLIESANGFNTLWESGKSVNYEIICKLVQGDVELKRWTLDELINGSIDAKHKHFFRESDWQRIGVPNENPCLWIFEITDDDLK